MDTAGRISSTKKRKFPALRWQICILLFASTAINYIDRQTVSLLAPYLKLEYHWTNTDYANLVVAFRAAYTIGQTAFGRLIDRIGTRRGLSLTVAFYSAISILTSLARGFFSFAMFRFLLGGAESANWPAATKAVSEWFPKHERALAAAFFDSGSSIGAALSPLIVLEIYFHFGWRTAIAIPGALGFLWLLAWRRVYPETAPEGPLDDGEEAASAKQSPDIRERSRMKRPWLDLLKLPQTWGTIVSKTFADPVWFFVTDWFPIYLLAKGINLRSSLTAIWIPFVAADAGNLFGGAASGYLIKRGWPLGRARKAVIVFGGVGVMALIPTIFTTNLYAIALLFGLATFAYGSFTTIANVLPADLYHDDSVATVSGMSGTGAGLGTIVAFELIGRFTDMRHAAATHSFDPILVAAGLIPFLGMLLILALVRNTKATEQGLVRKI
ncbi:MAG TPA: MFS transporter [Candidatus Acidoferrum sp.]|nr:MFS transporter [Candidatus Acidoferrum sp.]